MEFIDTHAHLYLQQFDSDRLEVLERAKSIGVDKILLPNIDVDSMKDVLALQKSAPDFCYVMMGLHPCSVKEDADAQLKGILHELDSNKCVAVGEIGLDYYWDLTFKEKQQEVFRAQLDWAEERNLPVAIHSREALDDIIKILSTYKVKNGRGVLHCFTGTAAQGKQLIDMGFYLGIGGVVTYKNSGLDAVVQDLPLDRLILETDAPYLTPVPHRGKRNESAYILPIAEKMAQIKGVSVDEIASVTTANALRLFPKIHE